MRLHGKAPNRFTPACGGHSTMFQARSLYEILFKDTLEETSLF